MRFVFVGFMFQDYITSRKIRDYELYTYSYVLISTNVTFVGLYFLENNVISSMIVMIESHKCLKTHEMDSLYSLLI